MKENVRVRKRWLTMLQSVVFVWVVLFVCPMMVHAEEGALSGDAESGYYLNMPTSGTTELVISEGVQTFKVYDDGGKDGNYSNGCSGYLVLTAPEGYLINLAGSVTIESTSFDYLRVYDGNSVEAGALGLKELYGAREGEIIDTMMSSGNQIMLYFRSDSSSTYAGLDLTVTIGKAADERSIIVDEVIGGTVKVMSENVEATKVAANKTVTVIGTPAEGYALTSIDVFDGNGDAIVTSGGTWYTNNTATFSMPLTDVHVKVTFTDVSIGEHVISQTMPVTGTKELKIAEDVRSFKLYDNGGSTSAYSASCDGYLKLIAPEGFIMKVTGTVTTEGISFDYLTFYDGGSTECATLGETAQFGGKSGEDVGTIVTSGNEMMVYFKSDGSNEYAGMDLTIKMIRLSTEYDINVASPINGTVEMMLDGNKVTTAPECSIVTVIATPDEGYMLTGICVTNKDGNQVTVYDGTWNNNNVGTFMMPEGAVTIQPVFVEIATNEEEVYTNMPVSGTQDVTISRGVKNFKIYDDGGKEGLYSNGCNGYMQLTAPEGYVIEITGSIVSESSSHDYLVFYDGDNTECTTLGENGKFGGQVEVNVVSTGNQMLIRFVTDSSVTKDGFDLTVNLIPIEYSISYDLAEGMLAEGEENPQKYTVESGEFSLVNPSREGYAFGGWTGTDLEEPTENVTIEKYVIGDRTYTAIWRKLLTNTDITVNVEDQTYAAAYNDSVSVYDGETKLVLGTDYEVSYTMEESVVEKPVNAGTYKVTLTGIGNYSGTFDDKNLIIHPAKLTVTDVSAKDRDYDKTNEIVIEAVTLNGVLSNDDVSVDLSELKATLSSADVGRYEYVTLPELRLIGVQASNYELIQSSLSYALATAINIEKADVDVDAPDSIMKVDYMVKTVKDVVLAENWTWKEEDQSKELPLEKELQVTAVYYGEDINNYENDTVVVTLIRQSCKHGGETVVKNKEDSTCKEEGYTGDAYCVDCDEIITPGTPIHKSTVHIWDEGVVTKEATATEKGEKTYTCTVCQTTKIEEIAALGAPVAGTVQTDSEGKATYMVTTSGLTDGEATYVKPVDKTVAKVIIPDTIMIDGITYKVTAIEKNAFKNNKYLKTITIGNNIKTIGANAFYNCTKLKTLKLGSNVTTIGDKAFYKCTSLTKVTIPSKVKTIGKSAFEGCKKLKTVTIGKSVTKIGAKAFYGCSKIKTLTIKSSKLTTKKIGSKAFTKTPKSMTVKIPKKKFKAYKSMLIKKGVNKKAKFKKS